MRPKPLLLLVLALGCGLVAAMGINQVLANRRAQAESAPGEMQRIYVAMQDIEARQAIDAQFIKLEDWPKDKVPAGAVVDLEKIQGRFTRTKIYAGEPVLEFKLVDSDAGFSPTALIPEGMRVVSVKVDEVSSSSSMVLPGDRVDILVFLSSHSTAGVSEATARTVLQDVRVFAVNEQYREDLRTPDEANIAARTVSLLVTPEQAEIVTLATQLGDVRLTLRGRTDEKSIATAGASASEILFGESSKADREQESLLPAGEGSGPSNPLIAMLNQQATPPATTPAAVPAPPAGPAPRISRVMVITGSEIKTVELIDGKPVLDAASPDSALTPTAPAETGPNDPVLTENEPGQETAGEEETAQQPSADAELLLGDEPAPISSEQPAP